MTTDQAHVVVNRHILRNTFSNYLGKFVNLITWFFLTPFILSQLGQAAYGLWVLVASLVAYGSLFDLGLASAITKFVAEYRAKGDYGSAQGLIATALSLYTLLGLIVFCLSLILAPFVPRLFNIPSEQHSQSISLLILSGFGIGLSIPSTAAPAVVRGLQRFDLINLVNIVGTLLSATGIVVVLLWTKDALGLVTVSILVNLLMLISTIWLIHKVEPQLRFGWRGASRKLARKVVSFSWTLFILNLNGYLETKTDEIVIGASLPVSSVTPYNIALKLSSLPQMLTSQFLSQILPLASALDAANDRAKLRSLYIASTRLALALFLPVATTLFILAGSILSFWVGASYTGYAPLVVVLTLASLIDTSVWPAALVLQGMARHRLLAVVSLLSGSTNLILSVILVQRFGLMGVAIGTLIPTSLVCLFFVYPYSMRIMEVSLRQAIAEIFVPAFVPALPMAAVLLILSRWLDTSSTFAMMITTGFGVFAYGVTYLLLDANIVERRAFVDLLMSTVRYVRGHSKSS